MLQEKVRLGCARALGALAASALLLSVVSLPVVGDANAREPDATEVRLCVQYRGEVRRRFPGYDHIVHLFNGCQEVVVCDVSSDVDPRAVRVRIEGMENLSVTLRRGSPSPRFTPRVVCALARVDATASDGAATDHRIPAR